MTTATIYQQLSAMLKEVRAIRADITAMREILDKLSQPLVVIEPTELPGEMRPGPFTIQRPFGVDGVSAPSEQDGGGVTTLTREEFDARYRKGEL